MGFVTDKQTLDDLNITGKFKPQSLFSLFNQTQTRGGEQLLDKMFNNPLSDADAINSRSATFKYFHDRAFSFPFSKAVFEKAENYLTAGTSSSYLSIAGGMLQKKVMQLAVKDEQYEIQKSGLLAAIEVINGLKEFMQKLDPGFTKPNFASTFRQVEKIPDPKSLSLLQVSKCDHVLRHTLRNDIEDILDFIYHLDVYIAVSSVARARKFSYAQALPKDQHVFQSTALHHPALEKAVANPIDLNQHENLLFLTGANMAGKSTFMKSLGIAVYLSHMGFPVAAKDMKFSVRDGLYTSINVSDNLQQGYSHFYAEVLRVKKVAEEVAKGNDLVVIFDELFKGTNVKDAFDATLAVSKEFAQYHNCVFVISTHIIEVGESLKQECDNLQYAYLPTIMEGSKPRYPYTLTPGITNDRHGMLIIENERILEMIS